MVFDVDRYLARIGCDGRREPSLAALTELQVAHLVHVPFENLHVFHGIGVDTSVDRSYDKIVEQRRGGWCFELNGCFAELLRRLGDEVDLLSCRTFEPETGALSDDFDHLTLDASYNRYAGYGQSKLANLLFTYELARRLKAKDAPTSAMAAHPGAANTELLRNVPGFIRGPVDSLWRRYAQSASAGALPPLRAATDPTARSGQYYGPDGRGEQRGHPKVIDSSARSHDEALARRLWEASEELTGVRYLL